MMALRPHPNASRPRRKEVRTTKRSLQSGQGMVEYALILVLVSIVVIVILLTMGGQIYNVFSNVVVALNA
jgi:pilus assembly protein Flp/PilA